MKQQFTIRIEVENIDDAKWIWDNFKPASKYVNGVNVTAIANGDMFKKVDALEEQLDIYMENMAYEIVDSDADRFEELEQIIEKSEERYINE